MLAVFVVEHQCVAFGLGGGDGVEQVHDLGVVISIAPQVSAHPSVGQHFEPVPVLFELNGVGIASFELQSLIGDVHLDHLTIATPDSRTGNGIWSIFHLHVCAMGTRYQSEEES